VVYRAVDLEAFVDARICGSTSEYALAA